MDARTLAEQLKSIDEKMTKAPWELTDEGHYVRAECHRIDVTTQPAMFSVHGWDQERWPGILPESEQLANASGIVTIRNLLPQIRKALTSSWVKISDDPNSLPQLSGECWGFLQIECNGQHSTRQDVVYFGIGRGWRTQHYGRDVHVKVTHYQPLPAPPEADTQ